MKLNSTQLSFCGVTLQALPTPPPEDDSIWSYFWEFSLKSKAGKLTPSAPLERILCILPLGSSLLFCLNPVSYLRYCRCGPTTSIFKPDINSVSHSHYCQGSNTNIAFVFAKAAHPMWIKCVFFPLLKQSGTKDLLTPPSVHQKGSVVSEAPAIMYDKYRVSVDEKNGIVRGTSGLFRSLWNNSNRISASFSFS